MGLIKADKVPPSVCPFSMADIEQQAAALLLRARQKADQVLQQAQREAQEICLRARATGLEDGRQQGLAQGRAEGWAAGRDQALQEHREELARLVSCLRSALEQFEASRRQLEAAALRDVIDLAVAIAQRLTKKRIQTDPEVTVANVTEALRLVSHASDLRIAVHPSQLGTLQEVLPELKTQWPQLAHASLVQDSSLAPGGCRLFTEHGMIDADLDEQLRRIVAELMPDQQSQI